MSERMYKDNYTNITNIDISDIVINQLKELYKAGYEKMKCILSFIFTNLTVVEMDATNMTYEDNKFDYIIDKGTLDALMVLFHS